tara:strand:+ start:171 stop:326 length:156 start_codon:yes stop_codon:yes gene_type:complete
MNEYKIKIGDEITEANNFFIDDPKIGQGYWVDENGAALGRKHTPESWEYIK